MGIIDLLKNATEIFLAENKVKAPLLCRKLDIEYSVARIIVDELELVGIISQFNDGGQSLLISSIEEFEEKVGEYYRSLFPIVREEKEQEDTSSYFSNEINDEEISNELDETDNEVTKIKIEEIGEHSFQSSVSRGGEVLFPEHIYINDFEVTWEKKSGVFSKDTKTTPIDEVTQIDLKTTLMNATIIIRSKGSESITAEHFTKSDAKRIKMLIEKVKCRLTR